MAHITTHQTPAGDGTQQRRAPKVDRPRLTDNLEEVGWNAFMQDWETFIRANGVADGDQAIQLFSLVHMSYMLRFQSKGKDNLHLP